MIMQDRRHSSGVTARHNEYFKSELLGLWVVRDSSRNMQLGIVASSVLSISLRDKTVCYESARYEISFGLQACFWC